MKDAFTPFTIIVAPDALADLPQNPPISSDRIDPYELLTLPAPLFSDTTLESPDDYFSNRFQPSKTTAPADHKELLADIIKGVVQHCDDATEALKNGQSNAINCRVSLPLLGEDQRTVQWLELYDSETESWLLPACNFIYSIANWSPEATTNESQFERFYTGKPRLAIEISTAGELLIHELVPQECYPEALENFFKAIRSTEPSFLYANWENSFRQYLVQAVISTEKNIDISIKEDFSIGVLMHSSTQNTQFGCSIALTPKHILSDSNLSCGFQCDITISFDADAYPKAIFSWRPYR